MAVLPVLLEAAGLFGFTWWLLARYRDAHVSTLGLAAVFLSWSLGFVGLLLLPIDIARHSQWLDAPTLDDDGEDVVPANRADLPAFVAAWQALYWLTFALSWLGLPLLVEYSQHGEFRFQRRLVGSFQRLVLHWTILIAVVVMAIAYLLFVGHFTARGIVGLAMATANTYGLIWLIVLLGYGLADIPRSLWTLRDPERRLRELQFRATQVHQERMEAIFLYQDVLRDVRAAYDRMLQAEGASIILTSDMQEVKAGLLTVLALVDDDDRSSVSSSSATKPTASAKMKASPMLSVTMLAPPPTYNEVVELHRRVKAAQADLRGTEQAWLELCVRADALHNQVFVRSTALPPLGVYSTTNLTAQVRTFATATSTEATRLLLPILWALGAVVTAFASVCVLWGELTMGWHIESLSLFHLFLFAGSGGLELAALALLLYMVLCTFVALFKLRSFGRFALRGHRNSSELALLKTSIHQCRLQFSLSYNFVLLIHAPALTDATAFHQLWSHMQVVRVLGRDFSVYAPVLMVALVACTLGNVYARLLKQVIGMEQYEQLVPGDDDHEKQVTKGEQLLRKARDKLRRRSERPVTSATSGDSVQWRGRGMQAPEDMATSLLHADGDDEEEEEENVA